MSSPASSEPSSPTRRPTPPPAPMPPPASTPPMVYISYSRNDRHWRDRIVQSLKQRETIRIWDDQSIAPGEDWQLKTEEALANAQVAILLISKESLASEFISQTEVPRFLKRGVRLIPVLLSACDWQKIPWLARIQLFPRDGEPLAELRASQLLSVLDQLAKEVFTIINGLPKKIEPSAQPAKRSNSKKSKDLGGIFGTREKSIPPEVLRSQKELEAIKSYLIASADYSESKIVGICGPRGIGKTTLALVLAHDDEIRRVFHDGIFYISSRKGSLMGQVRDILSDGLPNATKASSDTLPKILAERKTLLIFNEPGLDEGSNFSDIKSLAPYSRILVATRFRKELERLQANIFELGNTRLVEATEPELPPHSRWEERLQSGQMTLKELFEETPLGNSMDEADQAAFRMGAAQARSDYSRGEINSLDLLKGYLLTAPPGKGQSEQALVQATLEVLAKSRPDIISDPKKSTAEKLWPIFSSFSESRFRSSKSLSGSEVMDVKNSSGLGQMLLRSVVIATHAGRPQPFSTRHLLACLLGPREWHFDPEGTRAIDRLGLDLPAIRRAFRDWMKQWRKEDNAFVMDSVLGLREPTENEEQADDAIASSSLYNYQKTYSAFTPDRSAYGRWASNSPLEDALGVGTHAGHLAQLIAAKDTQMPLSIGLFGAWGAGKSHFIDLLDERLRWLTGAPGKVFHQEIVQIRFNAWHYLDTNLWANLVCEIFDQLFAKLNKGANKEKKQQVDNLKKALAAQSALKSEADEALKTAEKARQKAEDDLRKAVKERLAKEVTVKELLNDLTTLLADDEKVKTQLQEVSIGLGLPQLNNSFAELEARAREVRSLGGRCKAIALAVFTGSGWWKSVLLLVATLAVPLMMSRLLESGMLKAFMDDAGRTVAQILAALAAISAWISAQVKVGGMLVSKLEGAYEKAKKVRAKRESEDAATIAAQKALTEKQQAEEAARHTLREAEKKINAISAEIAELAPGRQLIRFLKERVSGEDYRRHLGLVSLVRRDFEQLSNLMTEASAEREAASNQKAREGGVEAEVEGSTDTMDNVDKAALPPIDRIVLYIDDLDRCRADRVIEVLEAVHLLLAFPLFAVVVAVDPRWLRQSLLDHYPRLLGGSNEAGGSESGRKHGHLATPQDYLEKIFQVPFHLQALEQEGYETLVKQLFVIEKKNLKEPSPVSAVPAAILPASTEEDFESDSISPSQARTAEEEKAVEPDFPALDDPLNPAAAPPPPDPQRLALTEHEVKDVQLFQPLFQTPRALKRLANTYCLIRVGVGEEEWSNYLGSAEAPGSYRVPMLLLAVTSAFPALARPWLLWLQERNRVQWVFSTADIAALTQKHADTTDNEDWQRLARALTSFTQSLDKIKAVNWPKPEDDLLKIWVPKVARYSF